MSIFVFPFNYTHTVCDTKLPFTCAHTYFPTIECLFNEAPISCTFDKRMKSTTHQAPTPKYFVSVCRVKKRNSEVVLLVEICGILSFHHWTFQHTDKKTSTFYFHMKSSKTFPLNSNPCEQIVSCQFGPSGKAKFEACQHIAPAQEPSERGHQKHSIFFHNWQTKRKWKQNHPVWMWGKSDKHVMAVWRVGDGKLPYTKCVVTIPVGKS